LPELFARAPTQLIDAAEYDAMNGLLVYLTENCCGRGGAVPFCRPAEALAEEECDGCG